MTIRAGFPHPPTPSARFLDHDGDCLADFEPEAENCTFKVQNISF